MALQSTKSSKLECQAISNPLIHVIDVIVHIETYTRFFPQFWFLQYFLNPFATSLYPTAFLYTKLSLAYFSKTVSNVILLPPVLPLLDLSFT